MDSGERSCVKAHGFDRRSFGGVAHLQDGLKNAYEGCGFDGTRSYTQARTAGKCRRFGGQGMESYGLACKFSKSDFGSAGRLEHLGRGRAMAQQVNGTAGSPSATVTLDGKQLPPPPMKFGGVIKQSAKDSSPWWPPRVVTPKGAPNVLLIMTDDQGYGVTSTFGGVIPTPAMDRIAKAGLRYTQFHSTALCSPTRAGCSSRDGITTRSASA